MFVKWQPFISGLDMYNAVLGVEGDLVWCDLNEPPACYSFRRNDVVNLQWRRMSFIAFQINGSWPVFFLQQIVWAIKQSDFCSVAPLWEECNCDRYPYPMGQKCWKIFHLMTSITAKLEFWDRKVPMVWPKVTHWKQRDIKKSFMNHCPMWGDFLHVIRNFDVFFDVS